MAKVPMINTLLLMISRGSYSVAVENASHVQPVVTAMRNVAESGSAVATEQTKDQIFWMRHPESGNWIPETHFDEIDVVELREKLLPKKKKP
ncbi:uncharacterized protein LOC121261935 isoform X3 [Juglans microcarpa x Juglans regia]|uniref:uncharacterized protein LOC121261935 isoform X3 n=1 Tax=Juglans microcarpa x Juglans regia TaxID=2249226 RepID=UPI001B7F76EA|nr:uncharacterized protein LOC121261935 isoform X3 [Juglans microcarpa x Juglans regia]